MITSKQELKYYLECDKKALGINYKRPRMFTDEIWRYQRSLRWLEYYTNVGGRKNFIMKVIEKLRFHNLSMKLGFSIPINTFGPGGNSSLWYYSSCKRCNNWCKLQNS